MKSGKTGGKCRCGYAGVHNMCDRMGSAEVFHCVSWETWGDGGGMLVSICMMHLTSIFTISWQLYSSFITPIRQHKIIKSTINAAPAVHYESGNQYSSFYIGLTMWIRHRCWNIRKTQKICWKHSAYVFPSSVFLYSVVSYLSPIFPYLPVVVMSATRPYLSFTVKSMIKQADE